MPATARAKAVPARGPGGPRAFKKNSVDGEHLTDELKVYVQEVGAKRAFKFYEYSSMWQNCAIRPEALALNKEFLDALLKVGIIISCSYTI